MVFKKRPNRQKKQKNKNGWWRIRRLTETDTQKE